MALLLFDDYDGVCINGKDFTFFTNGQPIKSIKKPDGYHVFTNWNEINVNVMPLTIKHPRYFEHSEVFKFDSKNNLSRVKKVRLQRKYSGGFNDCEWFYGINKNIPQNSEIIAFARVADKNGEDVTISINADGVPSLGTIFPQYSLLGRRFALNIEDDNNKDEFDTFIINQKSPEIRSYQIEGGNITPTTSQGLYAVYSSKVEQNGVFYIPHTGCDKIFKYAYKKPDSDLKAKSKERGVNEWVFVSVVAGK